VKCHWSQRPAREFADLPILKFVILESHGSIHYISFKEKDILTVKVTVAGFTCTLVYLTIRINFTYIYIIVIFYIQLPLLNVFSGCKC